MLIPSNDNIRNCFTKLCLLEYTSSLINFARWVTVLLLQRQETFSFLSDPLNTHPKSLIGKLIKICQESLSCKLILLAIWKLQQYRFFFSFKKIRQHNVFIFLVLSFILLMLIVSDDTVRERWGVTCVIKLLTNQHLCWNLKIYVQP